MTGSVHVKDTVPNHQDLLDAYTRVKPFVHRTPVFKSETLDQIAGCTLYFKCENLQKVGAFKYRGATNAVLQLSETERACGVATHSSGNHGQALAKAAQVNGIASNIVMPNNAPQVKVDAIKGYGGNVTICEPTVAARESTLKKVLDQTGAVEIHPYNNYKIIAGASTAAQEFLEHPNFTSDQKKDPLHIACAEIAENRLRFSLINEKLYKFIKPCIESSTDYMGNLNATRLVKAACLLSEICWDEEPSMRANLAFEKINALPIYSLSHPERLWISLAIFYRYNGIKSMTEKPISSEFILTHSQQEYAYFIGLGLRFGLIFSAGINTNLDKIKLYLRKQTLTCAITKNGAHLFTSQNQLRLKSFADILSLKTKIIYQN